MFAAVAMISAVSCNQELNDEFVSVDRGARVFKAMFDNADTKAMLSEGTRTNWEYRDIILVYDGSECAKYMAEVEDTARVADFYLADGEWMLNGDKFLAVYPEWADGYKSSSSNIDSKTLDAVWLEQNQSAREGSYDPRAALAMAYAEGTDSLVFKNATALLKFSVLNENVKTVTVYSHGGEALTGLCSLAYNDGKPVAAPIQADNVVAGWAELSAGDYIFEVGKEYYLSVFPQVLETGFTVEFGFEGVSRKVAVKSYDKAVEFKRNVILNLGEIEFTGELPADTGWGIVGAVNNWGADGPDVPMEEYYDGLFVAYSVELPEGPFKIRWNNDWKDDANYGLEQSGTVEADHVYNVITSGGSGDMNIAAGTYDIWFDQTASCVYVMTPGNDISNAQVPSESEPQETVWYLVGSFNGWTVGDAAYVMDVVGDYHVYYDFTLDADEEVKFNAGGWDNNRGGSSFAVNSAVSVWQGGDNLRVPAGTYDVYMNFDTNTVYFMDSGMTPDDVVVPD